MTPFITGRGPPCGDTSIFGLVGLSPSQDAGSSPSGLCDFVTRESLFEPSFATIIGKGTTPTYI